MYEVVATVNGIDIYRMKGSRKCYHINIREGRGWKEFHTFTTLKAAKEFASRL